MSDEAARRNTPCTSWRPVPSARTPSLRVLRASRACSRKAAPSGVSRRLRVERTKSGTCSSDSSRLRAALAAAGVMSSARAAAERLPASTVRTKIARSCRAFIFKFYLKLNSIQGLFFFSSNRKMMQVLHLLL